MADINFTYNINDTFSNTTPSPGVPTIEGVVYLSRVLNLFAVPVIIIIGLVGNALSGLVFIRSPLKVLSSSTVSNRDHLLIHCYPVIIYILCVNSCNFIVMPKGTA